MPEDLPKPEKSIKQIDKDVVDQLNTLIKECNNEGNLNIQLVLNDGETFDKFMLHYGKIQNAKNYLAMVGKKDKKLNVPDWYKKGIEYSLLAPTSINQQKFKFELSGDNVVSLKPGIGPMAK